MKITYPKSSSVVSRTKLSMLSGGTIFTHPDHKPFFMKIKSNDGVLIIKAEFINHVLALNLESKTIAVVDDTDKYIEYDSHLAIRKIYL